MKSPDTRERSAENLIKAQGYALVSILSASLQPDHGHRSGLRFLDRERVRRRMEYLPRGAAKRADSRLPWRARRAQLSSV